MFITKQETKNTIKTVLDLEYKSGLKLNLFLPESKNYDLLVYFHGGGFVEGSRAEVEPFAWKA